MDQEPLESTTEDLAVEDAAPVENAVAVEATGVDADAPLAEEVLEGGPVSAADAAAATPTRPREVIRGIHPELLCQCEECEPEHVELQWFSIDEARKVKGTAMLFCAYSSRKYFTPVPDIQAFLTANPVKPTKRGSKDAS